MSAHFSRPMPSPGRFKSCQQGFKRTVVASHKRIAVAASHLAVHKFSCALERDVHVAINRLELAYTDVRVSTRRWSLSPSKMLENPG